MTVLLRSLVVSIVVVLAGAVAGTRAQDWPQFLGPNGTGVADAPIPATAKLMEAWRKPIGAGTASIVVSRGRAFTMFSDDTDDYVIALDAASGRELWRASIGKTHADALNGGPGSTPAVAGELIVALGSSCRVQAFTAADGKPAWQVDLAADYKTRFVARGGCSISPVVNGNLVVVPTGATEGDRLVAIDAQTGRQVWSAKGVERSINTTPARRESPAGPQLLYHYVKPPGTSGVAAVALRDGTTAWSLDAESGMSNTAPMPLPDGRVLLQTWSGSSLLEAPPAGVPRRVWTNDELIALWAPAVYLDGHLYGFGGNSEEFFKCLDASTGAVRWSTRIYRGAAVIAGKTLVIQSESSGLLRLVAADPVAYRELTKLPVLKPGASTQTPPTVAGGMILVRNLEEIVAVAVR